jgi:hypothetical protein
VLAVAEWHRCITGFPERDSRTAEERRYNRHHRQKSVRLFRLFRKKRTS